MQDFKFQCIVARKNLELFRKKFDLKESKIYKYLVTKLLENLAIENGIKLNKKQIIALVNSLKGIKRKDFDGSLNNTGVEIISHPMTYENIINSNHWKLLFDLLKENDMNNTENCGLHFHLDKIYFSNDNIKALDYIVHKSERIL